MASTTNTDGLILRLAVKKDLQQIHLLEQRSNPFPWSRSQLQSSYTAHQIWLIEKTESVDGNQIVAFLICQQVLDEENLLHIVVDAKKKSQGIGHFLLENWLNMLPTTIINIWLEVRQSNLVAQHLYLAYGFKKVDSRRDYYLHHLTNPKLARETADIFCLNRNSD